MCPGAAAPRLSTSRARARRPPPRARARRPGRGCPAARRPVRPGCAATSSGTRQSTPTTSAPAAAIRPSSSPVSTPKWIRGTSATDVEHGAAVRQHVALVVGRRQRAGPRVEQLHRAARRHRSARGGAPPRSRPAGRPASCQASSSPYISAFVRAWSRLGPPSTRYDASVNGAPAKPISGVAAELGHEAVHRVGDRRHGVGVERREPARHRPRCGPASATTGPTPGLMSRSTPAALTGSTMSLKRIAASTPYRRTGCSVISVTRSGRRHDSSIPTPSRSARYSGSERPACRMNQTGVCGTGSPPAGAQERTVSGIGHASIVSRRPVTGQPAPAEAISTTPASAATTPVSCTRLSRSACTDAREHDRHRGVERRQDRDQRQQAVPRWRSRTRRWH